MDSPPSPTPPFTTWRRIAIIVGVWALVAVMSTQTSAFAITRTGRTFEWKPIFFSNLLSCMLWAAFTPFLLALGRRFRIESSTTAAQRHERLLALLRDDGRGTRPQRVVMIWGRSPGKGRPRSRTE